MKKGLTGSEIRQSYIDFFVEKKHTAVPSASLVPGGDQTLLFTNAGMVQFKDIFLGTDSRTYTRAVDSQKVMRVAGKHNDLDEVGRDDTHHTFFEMLGNWSFGDYYKKEAIAWAWELLTEVWGLDKTRVWATCFKDEKNEIPKDEEAAKLWREMTDIDPEHVLYFGRADNFWEMAETGPCGPCSEIHFDLGPEACDKKDDSDHVCGVNGDCARYLELWNLVFIQYNRKSEHEFEPLPATHVDTGLGFERIVSVLQGVDSNYKTDLLMPLLDKVQEITGHSDEEREENLTPYRVIADHVRASTFLIADGVVPGNMSRNYVCRMIIRRAALFGRKLNLEEPFMAEVAQKVIDNYGDAYPELKKNEQAIKDNLLREEKKFRRTVEFGLEQLENMIAELRQKGENSLVGDAAFDLYATHGLPLEITRDIAREFQVDVDESGFREAMESHRLASGAGKSFGVMGGEDAEFFHEMLDELVENGKLKGDGVDQDPYNDLSKEAEILKIIKNGQVVDSASEGDEVEIVLDRTPFYIESGGQVSDMGFLYREKYDDILMQISEVKKPVKGIVIHSGKACGKMRSSDKIGISVEDFRRQDIKRNHTATHLLHTALHQILGDHARQAGSLVAPDYLRFDFTHSEAMTKEELEKVERTVNQAIYSNLPMHFVEKSYDEALEEGATALFGEKYDDVVRTVSIGARSEPFSYELCGGTHVANTSEIGVFFITSESSIASGVRRIEAVTGRKAYDLSVSRSITLSQAAASLRTTLSEVPSRIEQLQKELDASKKRFAKLRQELVKIEFEKEMESVPEVDGIAMLATQLHNADSQTLREMADKFRQKFEKGVIVLGAVQNDRPILIASFTDCLVKQGYHAGKLVKEVAAVVGGGGGGKPNMAQAGGKDPEKLQEALDRVVEFVKKQKV